MAETPYEVEIETLLREFFDQNFEDLRAESGRTIAPDVKITAWNQVLLYWKKLQHVAETVTDTEVLLSLPLRESPGERDYTIQGVVDIVEDDERTIMYDIKSFDADLVRADLHTFEQQLNVYAHIWHELRQKPLDEVAVIATAYPDTVERALESNDPEWLEAALRDWEPIIPITYDIRRVEETIAEFGAVVDAIEENRFHPRFVDDLRSRVPGRHTNTLFATNVCRNCDARFSCSSYREYAWGGGSRVRDRSDVEYYKDVLADDEQERWRTASMDASPDHDALVEDFE